MRTPSKSKLQMADIARLAGVSTATVSRALSGSKLVNDETRKRIEELAGSLEYTVNIGAKNLRSGDNRTIAVVIPYQSSARQTLCDPFFLSMIGELATVLTENDYEMLLSRVDENDMPTIGSLYTGGRAAGIIVIGQWHHHDDLNALAARGVPMVVWGSKLEQQVYCTVGSDNELGGLQATSHLIKLGAEKILFLGDVELPEVSSRYKGYCKAHKKARLAVNPQLCLSVSFEAGLARQAIANHFSEEVNFDAVFASSDLLAVTAISALNELGIRVPEDIKVVGYDDIDMAQHYRPSLTTIRQPLELAGPEILSALERQIRGERVVSSLLPTSLEIRESSGVEDGQHAG